MSLLYSSPPVSIESVPVPLLNALSHICISSAEHEMALVLDDYHVIEAEPIHKSVTFLLGYLPSHVHILIATRVDPPLSLARLRTRGQNSVKGSSNPLINRGEV